MMSYPVGETVTFQKNWQKLAVLWRQFIFLRNSHCIVLERIDASGYDYGCFKKYIN